MQFLEDPKHKVTILIKDEKAQQIEEASQLGGETGQVISEMRLKSMEHNWLKKTPVLSILNLIKRLEY